MAKITNAWSVLLRTSLPKVSKSGGDIKIELEVYDNFSEAKQAFLDIMKKYSLEDNAMFDGKGHIKNLENYFNEMMEYLKESEEEELADLPKAAEKIMKAFNDIMAGKNVDINEIPYYNDYMIEVDTNNGYVVFNGSDDGPCNGYDPYIKTNIFNMDEEKEYCLHIDDLFGQDWSAEFYLDLIKG